MSDESYRILSNAEVENYVREEWFYKESFWIENSRWAVPEKRLLKELDKKKFYRQKLQELIDEFEFWKVENIMEVLEWTWAGIIGYPRKDDMIKLVENLYNSIESRVLKGEYCFCATGGFKLTFDPDEDNELSLVFEAVTNSVYGN
jgi:hypothetical protein